MKMDFLQELNRIMENTNKVALATAVDTIPNVRIVNFYYNPENKGVLYFSSFKGKSKTIELSQNNIAAFTTFPVSDESAEHVRVKNATVIKSDLTIYDLKDGFIKKLPSYEMLIAEAGDMLDVYEIHFNEANVTLDINQAGKVTF
jgi:uncharacterized pyridoxamine 5'-phosphate oxidase family protein